MAKAKAKIKMKIKLKTKRSAAKRLKVTGTGKVVRRKGWKGHLLTGKNSTPQAAFDRCGGGHQGQHGERQADASLREQVVSIEIQDSGCRMQSQSTFLCAS